MMGVRNWKFNCNTTENRSPLEHIVHTLLLWASWAMIWFFGIRALEEVFTFVVVSGKAKWLWGVCSFTLWFLIEVLRPRFKNKNILRISYVWVVSILIGIWYYFKHKEALNEGLRGVTHEYLVFYNKYNKTSYQLPAGAEEFWSIGISFALVCVWIALVLLGYSLRSKWLVGLFGVLSLATLLATGRSPFHSGVLFFFAGCCILISQNIRERKSAVRVRARREKTAFGLDRLLAKELTLGILVFALVLPNMLYKDELKSILELKPRILEIQDEIETKFSLFGGTTQIQIQYDKETLTNDARKNHGREILSIITSAKPYQSVYLKGYNGNVYKDGTWSGNDKTIQSYVEYQGQKEEQLAQALFDSGYQQLQSNQDTMSYEINYVGVAGNMAHVPYFSDFASLDGNKYRVESDYLLGRTGWDTIRGVALNLPRISYDGNYSLGEFAWYGNVVYKEYREVPLEIRRAIRGLDLSNMVGDDASTEEITAAVRQCLADLADYTLEPMELPADADPIVFFLTESKEGYCMHFASAATMMLRYMGVPARYVSGYVIDAHRFKETKKGYSKLVWDEETKSWVEHYVDAGIGYTAKATDYNEHAWVEYFVDGLGWVPLEVTPGYGGGGGYLPTEPGHGSSGSENSETESQNTQTEDTATEDTSMMDTSTQDTPIPDTATEDTSTEDSGTEDSATEDTSTEDTSTEDTSTEDTGTEDPSGGGGSGSGSGDGSGWSREDLLWGLYWLILVVIVGIIGYKVFDYSKQDKLARYLMKKKRNRSAIRVIHKQMRRQLFMEGLGKRPATDRELETLLVTNFPQVSGEDWKEYMRIAKKMAFSKEEITGEEVEHFYQCYVDGKTKKKNRDKDVGK